MDELIYKVIHASATKSCLITNDVTLTRFKRSDRLLCTTCNNLLACDAPKAIFDHFATILIRNLTDTSRNNCLYKLWRLHDIRIAKLPFKGGTASGRSSLRETAARYAASLFVSSPTTPHFSKS